MGGKETDKGGRRKREERSGGRNDSRVQLRPLSGKMLPLHTSHLQS